MLLEELSQFLAFHGAKFSMRSDRIGERAPLYTARIDNGHIVTETEPLGSIEEATMVAMEDFALSSEARWK